MHRNLSLLLIGLAFLGCEDNDECIDESQILDDSSCTEQYQPVCGCDDITYSNSCNAQNAGVVSWVDGKC